MFRLRDWSLTVLGTDISEEALREAREGVFNPRAIEAVSQKQLRRYFRGSSGESTWQVRPEIKELVQFENHNLMTPMRHIRFDCIFIRNVLIYFDRASKQVVVNHLYQALAPDGYLVVGPSEGVYDMLEPFKKHSPFLYQKL